MKPPSWLTGKGVIGALISGVGYALNPDVMNVLPPEIANGVMIAGAVLSAIGLRHGQHKAEAAATAAVEVIAEAMPMELPHLPAEWGSANQSRILRSLEPVVQILAVEHLAVLKAQTGGAVSIRLNSGRRTAAEQQRLLDARQRGEITVPVSAVGHSLHQFGLAYDGEPVPKTLTTWEQFGVAAESVGLKWGGRGLGRSNRIDKPHVELPGKGAVLRQLAGTGFFAAMALAIGAAIRRRSKGNLS